MDNLSRKQLNSISDAYNSIYMTEEQYKLNEEKFQEEINTYVETWLYECIEEGIDISQYSDEHIVEAICTELEETGYLAEFDMSWARKAGESVRGGVQRGLSAVKDKVKKTGDYAKQVVKDTARGLTGQGSGAGANTGSRLGNLAGRAVSSVPRAAAAGMAGSGTKSRNPVAQATNVATQVASSPYRAASAFGKGLLGKGGSSASTPKKAAATPAARPAAATPAARPAAATPAARPAAVPALASKETAIKTPDLSKKDVPAKKPKMSRLDKALAHASDSKNKDDWMKESLERSGKFSNDEIVSILNRI